MLNQNRIFYSFFLIAIALLITFLTIISNVLLPFVIGIILAYLLNPIVKKIQSLPISRALACFIVISCFMIIILFCYVTIGPVLAREFISLIQSLPRALKASEEFITPFYQQFISHKNTVFFPETNEIFIKISNYLLSLSTKLLGNIWQSGIVLVNLFSLLFITPIVTFYLLKDWEQGLKHLQKLIPKRQSKSLNKVFREIDEVLSAYLRGQTLVCLILGLFYAISLTIVGLNHGFLIGFLTGLLSFIPYLGMFLGMTVGIIVAFFQFNDFAVPLIVFTIFIIGQIIEGNFITPNLVGDKIGINPVIIIFTLLAGGSIFGFIGILFAIPFCAIMGVVMRNLITTYNKSKFYRFTENRKPRNRKSHG